MPGGGISSPCQVVLPYIRYISRTLLVVVLVGLVIDDVEKAKFVYALGSRDHAEPVAELLLLEELLGATILSGR